MPKFPKNIAIIFAITDYQGEDYGVAEQKGICRRV